MISQQATQTATSDTQARCPIAAPASTIRVNAAPSEGVTVAIPAGVTLRTSPVAAEGSPRQTNPDSASRARTTPTEVK